MKICLIVSILLCGSFALGGPQDYPSGNTCTPTFEWGIGGACNINIARPRPLRQPIRPFKSPIPQIQPDLPYCSVVQVRNNIGRETSIGSGVFIERKSNLLVLTCSHLFDDGIGSITIQVLNNQPLTATLIDRDKTWDIALLHVSLAPSKVTTATLSLRVPNLQDRVTICGYTSGSANLRFSIGHVYQYNPPTRTHPIKNWFSIAVPVPSGYSGGPIFNSDKELTGIVWGSDRSTSTGTNTKQLQLFIEHCLSKLSVISPILPLEKSDDDTNKLPLEHIPPTLPLPKPLPDPAQISITDAPITKPKSQPQPQPQLNPRSSPIRTKKGSEPKTSRSSPTETSEPLNGGKLMELFSSDWFATTLTAFLQGLGYSTPPSAVALTGLLLLKTVLLKRKKDAKQEVILLPENQDPVEPMKPVIKIQPRDREFVGYYPASRQLKAMEFSHDEYVRRFPGARHIVQTMESYASQYLASHPKPQES